MAEMMNNDLPKTEEVAKSAVQKTETEAPKKKKKIIVVSNPREFQDCRTERPVRQQGWLPEVKEALDRRASPLRRVRPQEADSRIKERSMWQRTGSSDQAPDPSFSHTQCADGSPQAPAA